MGHPSGKIADILLRGAARKTLHGFERDGEVYVRRRIKHDGTPECVPMLPHERISRASSFGLVDVSAQPVAGSTLADFDPLERERLRQALSFLYY